MRRLLVPPPWRRVEHPERRGQFNSVEWQRYRNGEWEHVGWGEREEVPPRWFYRPNYSPVQASPTPELAGEWAAITELREPPRLTETRREEADAAMDDFLASLTARPCVQSAPENCRPTRLRACQELRR